MSAAKRILVVDDDVEIRELLQEYLTKAGYDVTTARDGNEMRTKVASQYPDLILLDIMLPGDDGFTLCKEVRRTSNVPIIMLTAVSDETDQIIGLELGADDYVAKPFSPRQLVARIRALLRRTEQLQQTTTSKAKAIRFDQWRVDPAAMRLNNLVTGLEVDMTPADFTLLMLFLEHPQELLDRNAISNALKGKDAEPHDRAIDVQVSRLRQRLKDSGKSPRIIKQCAVPATCSLPR